MKGKRHSEQQIIAIRKQGDAGLATAALGGQHGITEQTCDRSTAEWTVATRRTESNPH
jgi:hypothetical protein